MAQNEAQTTETVGNKVTSYFNTVKDNIDVEKISSALKQITVFPQENLGIAGYVFDITKRYEVSLQSTITEHYIEDNSFIQDHISNQPATVTVNGFVGEIAVQKKNILNKVADITQKLTVIQQYASRGISTVKRLTNAYENGTINNTTSFLKYASKNTKDIYSLYKDFNSGLTKQGRAFQFFSAMRDARQLVSIETPWKFYQNMIIQTLTATRDEDKALITDFSITFKEVRFATLNITQISKEEYQARAGNQASEEQAKGEQAGEEVSDKSVLKKFSGSGITKFISKFT